MNRPILGPPGAYRLDAAIAALRVAAPLHDQPGSSVTELVQPLVEPGLFRRVLPAPCGDGLATDAARAGDLFDILRRIGGANLSAGRIFEGHANAVKLVFAFGDEPQKAAFAAAVMEGALSGVWNAEAAQGVTLVGAPGARRLQGDKIYASGVGTLTRPLITARTEDGGLLMTIPAAVQDAPHDLSGWRMRGMRATATGTAQLTDVPVAEREIIGQPGDYYRSPGFRGGAWRFAAVQLGAVEAIVALMRQGLVARGRSDDPHQKARMAKAEIAVETARLWTRRACTLVEGAAHAAEDADAYAGMARLVVERAGLDVIELAERALGLMAFAQAEPIERMVRDLSTYLRQPFPDAVLEGIGAWSFARGDMEAP